MPRLLTPQNTVLLVCDVQERFREFPLFAVRWSSWVCTAEGHQSSPSYRPSTTAIRGEHPTRSTIAYQADS